MPQGLRLPAETQAGMNQVRKRMDPQDASVLDGTGDKLMRMLGQILGVGTPEDSLMGVAGPLMAAGKAPLGIAKSMLGRIDETQGPRHMIGEIASEAAPSPMGRPMTPGLKQRMEELEMLRREATEQAGNQRIPGAIRGIDQYLGQQQWLGPRLRQIDEMVMDAAGEPGIWQTGPRLKPTPPWDLRKQEPMRPTPTRPRKWK
jgi:hypothetical protein